MMPVAPTAKRSHGFSIDSLMGKDPPRPRSTGSGSPEKTNSSERASVPSRESREPTMGGVGSSFHPVHPGAGALLNGLKGLYQHAQAHAHGPRLPGDPPHSLPEGMPPLGLPLTLGPGGPIHPGLGLPGLHHPAGLPPHPLFMGAQRDPFSLYPWLLSRQGSVFPHPRLAGPEAGLLYQPFRKPKRIRTAFSPSQLLRLEHAFEKNHYVVGQERKDLAATLSLTETQVKVWFQNRRTKYKRLKAEEAETDGQPRSEKDPDANDSREDSDIDMGDNEGSPCGSPKNTSFENGHYSGEEDDVEIEASDTEDDVIRHQRLLADQFRLYQSQSLDGSPQHDRTLVRSPSPPPSQVPPPKPYTETNWSQASPAV